VRGGDKIQKDSRVNWEVPYRKISSQIGIWSNKPPTPRPTTASREAKVKKFGEPPAASPKTPAISRVCRVADEMEWETNGLRAYKIETPFASPNVGTETPDDSAYEETDVSSE
jgi:hypothetical protein